MANQSLQTRYLLIYVIAVVVASIVPIIIQEIVNPFRPDTVNIRHIQWATCAPVMGSRIPWYIGASVIPTLVVLFGVFLAFNTRNVAFLWNEARQIAWVLYNTFFLLVVLIIVQTFGDELYMAAYYIMIVVTYFAATFALLVLFLPKIVAIWVSVREERLKNSIGDDWKSPLRRENFSSGPGDAVMAPNGSGPGGHVSNLGPGTTLYSSGSSSIEPKMSIVEDNPQWSPTPEHPLSPPARVALPGATVNTGSNMVTISSTSFLEKIQTNPDMVLSASTPPTNPQFQRVISPSHSENGNPLSAWMTARLPSKDHLDNPFLSPFGGILRKNSVSRGKERMEQLQPHLSNQQEQEMTTHDGGSKPLNIQPNGAPESCTDAQHAAILSKSSLAGASKVVRTPCKD